MTEEIVHKPVSFYKRAANLSAVAPLGLIAISYILAAFSAVPSKFRDNVAVISTILILFLTICGLIAGVIGLYGVRHYGRKGLLSRSLTGISISIVVIAFAAPTAFHLWNSAK